MTCFVSSCFSWCNKWTMGLILLYVLPSIIKPSKNNIINALRLPGIAIRAAILGIGFILSLALALCCYPFLKSGADMNRLIGYLDGPLACALFGVTYNFQNFDILRDFDHGIIVLNHQSFFDAPFSTIIWNHMKLPIVGVAKMSLSKWPILGAYWRIMGGIFVENATSDKAQTEKSIEVMKSVSDRIKKEKLSVGIFPEGHRNIEPKILEFKRGAFHMAVDAGVPILPIVIQTYYDKLMECNWPWNRKIIMIHVLPIISTADCNTKDDVAKLTMETQKKMEYVLNQINKIDS